jgi:hypothetical protein
MLTRRLKLKFPIDREVRQLERNPTKVEKVVKKIASPVAEKVDRKA